MTIRRRSAIAGLAILMIAAWGAAAPLADAQDSFGQGFSGQGSSAPGSPGTGLIPQPLYSPQPIGGYPSTASSLAATDPSSTSSFSLNNPAPSGGRPAAAPPPDPAAPQWGNYSAPFQPPITLPTMTYTLAAPPRSIVQPSTGLEYRAIVTDPDGVQPSDDHIDEAIVLTRADGIGPAGVVGDHTLPAGQALVSYRYQGSFFDHNLVGSHRVSDASVQAAYNFVPSHLTQSRSTLLIEYAPTDDLTLLIQSYYYSNSIAYNQAGSPTYTSAFTNPGDVSLTGLYVLYRRPGRQLHASLGVSAPTGFLFYQTVSPSPTLPNLPYDLRTGSGTWDILPGLTYRVQTENWTWGAQTSGIIRNGLNYLDYRLGSQADFTAWMSRHVADRWAVSGRLDALVWGNIYRGDPKVVTTLAPTNDPNAQGGQRLNGLIGVNYFLPGGRLPSSLFSVEGGLPMYQRLSGPQLGLDWIVNANWNILF